MSWTKSISGAVRGAVGGVLGTLSGAMGTSIPEQQRSAQEQQLLGDQMTQYQNLKGMAPTQLAMLGYKQDAKGNITPLSDAEAKTMLSPQQYNVFQAANQQAAALASGQLPQYMQNMLNQQNQQVLSQANQRLGPGGYYMSTPGQQYLNQTAMNTAQLSGQNQQNELGLLTGEMGFNQGMGQALAQPAQGLLASGENIQSNMFNPFHGWSQQGNVAQAQNRAGLTGGLLGGMSKIGAAALGG